jgi:hypothetical protein
VLCDELLREAVPEPDECDEERGELSVLEGAELLPDDKEFPMLLVEGWVALFTEEVLDG